MDTPRENWIGEALEAEAVHGRRYGYDEAMAVVAGIVTELYKTDSASTARLIHEKVWKRLDAERDARLQRKS